MARRGPFRNMRIDDDICVALEKRMAAEHRRGSLNPYIEEILDKWVNGFLVENNAYKAEIAQQAPSRKVHHVGPAKGVITDDEGKRKVS